MTSKKIFADITVGLGVVFLICMAIVFFRTASDNSGMKALSLFGGLGLLFLVTGLLMSYNSPPKVNHNL